MPHCDECEVKRIETRRVEGVSMEGPCTEEQIIAPMEGIFDWIDLDNLQQQVIDAVGLDWADDINSAITNLECEIRKTIRRDMRKGGGAMSRCVHPVVS
ncbi:MAG: hypothetical protein V8S24_07210 [Gordonibacter pamelaeae]